MCSLTTDLANLWPKTGDKQVRSRRSVQDAFQEQTPTPLMEPSPDKSWEVCFQFKCEQGGVLSRHNSRKSGISSFFFKSRSFYSVYLNLPACALWAVYRAAARQIHPSQMSALIALPIKLEWKLWVFSTPRPSEAVFKKLKEQSIVCPRLMFLNPTKKTPKTNPKAPYLGPLQKNFSGYQLFICSRASAFSSHHRPHTSTSQ